MSLEEEDVYLGRVLARICLVAVGFARCIKGDSGRFGDANNRIFEVFVNPKPYDTNMYGNEVFLWWLLNFWNEILSRNEHSQGLRGSTNPNGLCLSAAWMFEFGVVSI